MTCSVSTKGIAVPQQPQQASPDVNIPIKEIARGCFFLRCRHWFYALLAGLILGSLAAMGLFLVCLPQYEAVALIRVLPVKPDFLFERSRITEHEYDSFVNTLIALMWSPIVLDNVLERPEIARLEIMDQQQDKRAWLAQKLRVERIHNSEIMSVGIKTDSEEASEKIVNAVTDEFFKFSDEMSRRMYNDLVTSLRLEERRQQQVAKTLQERIRRKTKESAMQVFGISADVECLRGESLVQDICFAEARILTQRAQYKAIVERIENPNVVPISVLIQNHPELQTLSGQRLVLGKQKTELARVYSEDDPRIVELDQQMERIDERISSLASKDGQESVQAFFRLQEETKLFELGMEIRAQEILVEELTNKYNEQLINSVNQSEEMLDVTFDQAQLERTNKTLERIEDRILEIAMEQRAPGQVTQLSQAIISLTPSLTKAIAIAGVGFAIFFFVPPVLMLCAMCCCRCCCRSIG